MKRMLAMTLILAMALGLGTIPALAAEDVTYSFEETVLVDTDDVKVTVTDFIPDLESGPTFTMLYENKTDKDVHFSIMDTYLDGRECDGYGSEDVAAGMQVYSDLHWYREDMAASGVNYVNNVMVDFWIRTDEEDQQTLFEDMVSWSVNAVSDTPSLTDVTFDSGFSEVPILSGDYTAVIKDFDPDGPWDDGEPSFIFYLENNTEEDVMFTAEDVAVNGTMCDPMWGADVAAGTSTYDYYFYWWAEDLEEAHIESFETVEFELVVRSGETYEDVLSEPVTVDLTGLGAAAATAAGAEEGPAAEEVPEEETGLTPEKAAALAEDEAAAAAMAEEEAAAAAEEPAAEEPAAAGPIDPAALAGGLDPDNPVYTNDVFRMSCSFDPSWGVVTEEKLAASVGWDEASGTDPVEYLGEYLIGGSAATVMYITSEDKNQVISIPVNAFSGAGQLENGSAAAGRNVLYLVASGGSLYETMGMQNCEMVPDTVTLDGVEYDGIAFKYDHVDKNTGETVPGYTEWLFLVCNDFENDQDYVMTIRLTSYGEDHIADMLGTLTMPADG